MCKKGKSSARKATWQIRICSFQAQNVLFQVNLAVNLRQLLVLESQKNNYET